MTDIAELLPEDVCVLIAEAGSEAIYLRTLRAARDTTTREQVERPTDPLTLPVLLLNLRGTPGRDGAGPPARTREALIADHGWEPRADDTIEVPEENRSYTVAAVEGLGAYGRTVAWRLTLTDGRGG